MVKPVNSSNTVGAGVCGGSSASANVNARAAGGIALAKASRRAASKPAITGVHLAS